MQPRDVDDQSHVGTVIWGINLIIHSCFIWDRSCLVLILRRCICLIVITGQRLSRSKFCQSVLPCWIHGSRKVSDQDEPMKDVSIQLFWYFPRTRELLHLLMEMTLEECSKGCIGAYQTDESTIVCFTRLQWRSVFLSFCFPRTSTAQLLSTLRIKVMWWSLTNLRLRVMVKAFELPIPFCEKTLLVGTWHPIQFVVKAVPCTGPLIP